jgi:hypothetical protein
VQFFHKLGSVVELNWRRRNYDEREFPAIAAEALAEANAIDGPSPWDMICSLHANLDLPTQLSDKFSDLAITLYHAPRFHISAYFWLDGTTSVHQHAFSGAFQVLLGSSIHSHYQFTQTEIVNPHMAIGKLDLKDIQLLNKGSISQIHCGSEFIHSLFHLDRPSVTLTIRTHSSVRALPQYKYLSPCLAIDPFFDDRVTTRRIQSIQLLLRMMHPEVDSFIGQLVKSLDFQSTYSILSVVFSFFTDPELSRVFQVANGNERFRALIDVAREKHGALVDLLPPVFEEVQRQEKIIAQRKLVHTVEQRFFLALLLNVPGKARILDLVSKRYPTRDPIDSVCAWVLQLSAIKTPALRDSNILGIDGFDETYLVVFRGLLENLSIAVIEQSLKEKGSLQRANEQWGGVEKMRHALENSNLLKTMFKPDDNHRAVR